MTQPQLINAPEEAPQENAIQQFKKAIVGDVMRIRDASERASKKGKRSRAQPKIDAIAQQFDAPRDEVDHLWGICILATLGTWRADRPRIITEKIDEFLRARPQLLAGTEGES